MVGRVAKVGLTAKLLRYIRDPAVATWRKASGLFAVAYVISPVDLIPDIIPVIGWLDDAGVVAALAMFMVREVRKHSEKVDRPPPTQLERDPGAPR